jgi:small subunit ribosomal protein S17
MSESSPSANLERGRRKSLIGTVVSVKMEKTAVVSVERRERHPLYRKIVRSTKRYKAHDPHNGAVLGDLVRIEETRPISKEKRWRIAETLVRGNVADVAPRDIGVPEEALETTSPPGPLSAGPSAELRAGSEGESERPAEADAEADNREAEEETSA